MIGKITKQLIKTNIAIQQQRYLCSIIWAIQAVLNLPKYSKPGTNSIIKLKKDFLIKTITIQNTCTIPKDQKL